MSSIWKWEDDVLDRAKLAEFLTASLTNSSRRQVPVGSPGLTVALDAGWGTGKSFFASRWARDLRKKGHPVVLFDAWENDIGEEASTALMAQIRTELSEWCKRLPEGKALQSRGREAIKNTVSNIRRALIPAAKVVATSALKKATGIAADELLEAMTSDSSDGVDLSGKASGAIESGLDEYFEKSMEAHEARSRAIGDFKKSINSLLELIHTSAGAALPMFVFVDEVDRCRPIYALRLLEEIKHIFGTNDTCFVVSTNLRQLTESVRAVYGANFDGHGYLTRFFDEFFTLPDPDNESYAKLLWESNPVLAGRSTASGLPRQGKLSFTHGIALIFEGLAVDLRSQRQVFAIASSVVAAIPQTTKIYTLWLFFLSSLRHKHPTLFEMLRSKPDDRSAFMAACNQAFVKSVEIEYQGPRSRDYREVPAVATANLVDVLWNYCHWSHMDLEKVWELANDSNTYAYPQANAFDVSEELPNPRYTHQRYESSLSRYYDLVRFAGIASSLLPAASQ